MLSQTGYFNIGKINVIFRDGPFILFVHQKGFLMGASHGLALCQGITLLSERIFQPGFIFPLR